MLCYNSYKYNEALIQTYIVLDGVELFVAWCSIPACRVARVPSNTYNVITEVAFRTLRLHTLDLTISPIIILGAGAARP